MITGLYAGLLTLFYIGLSFYVVKGRRKFRVAMGDNNEAELRRRVRAHANFAEYAPLFIILLGFSEIQHLKPFMVHALGLLFVSGRMMHAYSHLQHEIYVDGQLTNRPVWRRRGMICTLGAMLVLSLILVIQFVLGMFS